MAHPEQRGKEQRRPVQELRAKYSAYGGTGSVLDRRCGKIGGKRSLETMTPEQRTERAKKASARSAEVRSKKAAAKKRAFKKPLSPTVAVNQPDRLRRW